MKDFFATRDTAPVTVLAVAIACAVVQLACLVRAAREYRRVRRWRESILEAELAPSQERGLSVRGVATSALFVVLQAASVVLVLSSLRSLALAAITGLKEPPVFLPLLADMAHAAALGTLYGGFALSLAGLGMALDVCARLQHAGLAYALASAPEHAERARAWALVPGPSWIALLGTAASFLWLGSLPMLAAVAKHARSLHDALDLGGIEPDLRVATVLSRLDTNRATLDEMMVGGAIGLMLSLVLGIVAIGVVPYVRRHRAGGGLAGAPRIRFVWPVSAIAVSVSIALVVAVNAHATENANPVSVVERGAPHIDTTFALVREPGPDPLEYAPLLRLGPSGASLDGRPNTAVSLEGDLTILRKNWLIVFPGRVFPGLMAVACDNAMPLSQLAPFLETARRSGYSDIALVMGGDWHEDRPVLERIHYSRFSSARVQLVDGADVDAVDLATNARMTCEWLVRLAAKTRAAGSAVKLKL